MFAFSKANNSVTEKPLTFYLDGTRTRSMKNLAGTTRCLVGAWKQPKKKS